MNEYEISIWQDVPQSKTALGEEKIAVIGSNTMTTPFRALSPNLIEDINGTHTFTFEMKTTYVDNMTGETCDNPFVQYLFNERKIKVKWYNQWYDLIVKKCQKDSTNHNITYTCTDLFINELSKNGYSIEFDTNLQNNIGTAEELAKIVLEGSSWQYNDELSTPIIQKIKGPVYETSILENGYITTAKKQSPTEEASENDDSIIHDNEKILVFYDSIIDLLSLKENESQLATIQFLYAGHDNEFQTDINETFVTNANCYEYTAYFRKEEQDNKQYLIAAEPRIVTDVDRFKINLTEGVSNQYTGERLVRSQLSTFDPLFNRYVLLCKDVEDDSDVYEIITTEYTDPVFVTNLVANPVDFTNTQGWTRVSSMDGEAEPPDGDTCMSTGFWPPFDPPEEDYGDYIVNYEGQAFLQLGVGLTYNGGIQSNISYFTPTETEVQQGIVGGIHTGEKYVLRFRFKGSELEYYADKLTPKANLSNTGYNYISKITGNLYKYNTSTFKPLSNSKIFELPTYCIRNYTQNDDYGWIELVLTAKKSVPAKEINNYGLFIDNHTGTTQDFFEIQFYKYVEGVTSYADDAIIERIDPGEISLQSLATEVYKYYKPNNGLEDEEITDAASIEFLYVGDTEQTSIYVPQYNNYEKVGTISIKESNRFNLLQTIAETFQAWVHFKIDHEENGAIKIIDGVPQKYIYFTSELGEDTGLTFEYGIDLKTISREVNSDALATKVLVLPNANEYAKNGFCTIARSPENYTKENFILNFDYYIQQGLLDKETLNKDLYGIDDESIGYYYYLQQYNSNYDDYTNLITKKQIELLRVQAEYSTYELYIKQATFEVNDIENELLALAGLTGYEYNSSEMKAFLKANKDNIEVASKLTTHTKLKSKIKEQKELLQKAETSINTLETYINNSIKIQKENLTAAKAKHQEFNNKYGHYIMEGTWSDESYIDDTKYYLDALSVAYTSSRPQVSYSINVLRLNVLEDFSSKVFHLGDICYVQDTEFFGYLSDRITPYKERILINKISYFFDDPSKDSITVQNYKTKFDDIFQRIAAATQSLQYSQGSYKRAADAINENGSIKSTILQKSFDQNTNLILNSSNQNIQWDNTGITITDATNSANQTKIIAGGLFITDDGGATWRNAVSGSGISANVLTAGRVNTDEVYIYNKSQPYFLWDKDGITAYQHLSETEIAPNSFVRFDWNGIYGYSSDEPFSLNPGSMPFSNENVLFSIGWDGFKLRSKKQYTSSTEDDEGNTVEKSYKNELIIDQSKCAIIIRSNGIDRVRIGQLNEDAFGMTIYDENANMIFGTGTADTEVTNAETIDTPEGEQLVPNGTGSQIITPVPNNAVSLGGGISLSLNGFSGNGWTLKKNGGYSTT